MKNDDDRLLQYVVHRSSGAYKYVVRQYVVRAGAVVALGNWGGAANEGELESLRAVLGKRGMTRMKRHPTDEPDIVEVWYS